MKLKSYRLKRKSSGSKKSKLKASKDFITGGVTALLGVALISETSNAVAKL